MLDRPIFVVGHARGGSTVLGTILNWHSHVGPRYEPIPRCGSIGEMLATTLRTDDHFRYSERLEQKSIWFDYFPGLDVFTNMGRELVVEEPGLSESRRRELVSRLTEGLDRPRFLSKSPTNSFRVVAIRRLFPDARIVAILRRGEEVVASWGRRVYGFGRKVDWGATQIERLSYAEGIDLFARKWRETIDYLEARRDGLDILTITYDQLRDDPGGTLRRVLRHVELPYEPYIDEVRLEPRSGAWRRTIPARHRPRLWLRVRGGNARLRRIARGAA